MTNEEIKKEYTVLVNRIEYAKNKIAELQSICRHEKTYDGNYSYRVGVVQPAVFCAYCDELIKTE